MLARHEADGVGGAAVGQLQHRLLLVGEGGAVGVGELGLQKRVALLLAIRVEVYDARVQVLVAGPVDAPPVGQVGAQLFSQGFRQRQAREQLKVVAPHGAVQRHRRGHRVRVLAPQARLHLHAGPLLIEAQVAGGQLLGVLKVVGVARHRLPVGRPEAGKIKLAVDVGRAYLGARRQLGRAEWVVVIGPGRAQADNSLLVVAQLLDGVVR